METETKPPAKKEWAKPELIVLVRSHPQEAVLAVCKDAMAGSANASLNSGCWYDLGGCDNCNNIGSS